MEINPLTKEAAWVYDAGTDFYTFSGGIVQRLPNGNTLISEDVKGRVFEVSPSKDTVWEFRSGGIRINRPRRYAFDYCDELRRFQ